MCSMGAKRRSLRLNKTGTKVKKNEDILNELMSSPSCNKAKCGNPTDLPPSNMPPVIVFSSRQSGNIYKSTTNFASGEKGKRWRKVCSRSTLEVVQKVLRLESSMKEIKEALSLITNILNKQTTQQNFELNPFEIYVPINKDNSHWYLLVIDFAKCDLVLLDSYPSKDMLEVRKRVVKKVIDHGTRLKLVVDLVIHPYSTIREDIIKKEHHHLE
ncbi:hypothetical protein VNO77_15839 [Canavalia gladiata]|uniref:Ubiquitin-like protease family profile domain-containing protein n=1 Tax=Canavalia gladiata TaxID=3824 RepID=A0AAN9QPE0_CANGL